MNDRYETLFDFSKLANFNKDEKEDFYRINELDRKKGYRITRISPDGKIISEEKYEINTPIYRIARKTFEKEKGRR